MIDIKKSSYKKILKFLEANQYKWIVTGSAGFIGSNIVEKLLDCNQVVIGVDNFSSGSQINLEEFENDKNFSFINSNLNSVKEIETIIKDSDFVLHQGALGSVPRSIKEPALFHINNVGAHFNILNAIINTPIKGMVYASSSSVYGDDTNLPKIEDSIGEPLSPYALTKRFNEEHSNLYYKVYNISNIGLRYFNVFGKRQNPNGEYAAVIPKWINAVIKNEDININGDGLISRDFCHVNNVVELNIRAALIQINSKQNTILNVACGKKTSLNELADLIIKDFQKRNINYSGMVNHLPPRLGDIQDSLADINKAVNIYGYEPNTNFKKALNDTITWYLGNV